MSTRKDLSRNFVKEWGSYINGLKGIAYNLTDEADKEELEECMKQLKRLARVAGLESYKVEVEEDVEGYLRAYQIA